MHIEAIRLAGELESKGYYKALEALYFAAEVHSGQVRDDCTDYIDHPVGVARIILNMKVETDPIEEEKMIIDALLHDVVEEKGVSQDLLRQRFGEESAGDVMALSKTKRVDPDLYYETIAMLVRLIIVKAADRLHNISNMVKTYSTDRLEKYAKETRERIQPMMKMARRRHPKYGKTLVVFRDIMKGILSCVDRIVEVSRENEGLRRQVDELTQALHELMSEQVKLQLLDTDRALNERDRATRKIASLE